jgi:hypothetical protein
VKVNTFRNIIVNIHLIDRISLIDRFDFRANFLSDCSNLVTFCRNFCLFAQNRKPWTLSDWDLKLFPCSLLKLFPWLHLFPCFSSKLSVSHIEPAYSTRSLHRYRLHLVCLRISVHFVTPACVLRCSCVTQGACTGTGCRLHLVCMRISAHFVTPACVLRYSCVTPVLLREPAQVPVVACILFVWTSRIVWKCWVTAKFRVR